VTSSTSADLATPIGAAPSVTVLVPARNEEASIGSCLDSLIAQRYRDLEIVVVDGDSDDATGRIVEDYAVRDPRIRLLRNPARTIPTGLNVGLAAARGTWLVRVDAHSRVADDYVGALVQLLESGRWGGVGGRKDGSPRTTAGVAIAAALGSPFGVGDSHYHHATAAREVDHVPFGAYPVALCRELGGWRETLTANEDYEFDYRLRQAGHRLLLEPSIRVDWQSRQSVGDLFRQYVRYGSGKADVAWLHPQSMRPRHFAAPLLVGELALAAAVAPRRPKVAAVLAAPYAVALTVASARTALRVPDRHARAYVPAAFAAMHIGWGVGLWAGLVRNLARRAGRA
jgi:glycosyltransferase involved in cell wall biosynthesis